jgi:hypothetical protein
VTGHGLTQAIDSVEMDCLVDSVGRHTETLARVFIRLMGVASS